VVTELEHAGRLVWVWGTEPPAFSVGYDEPLGPRDSGFTAIFSDAPEPLEVEGPDDPRISVVCLHCLIDHHPEIGRALDLARAYGAADLDENGAWVGRHIQGRGRLRVSVSAIGGHAP
jgi:hypothetical protein